MRQLILSLLVQEIKGMVKAVVELKAHSFFFGCAMWLAGS